MLAIAKLKWFEQGKIMKPNKIIQKSYIISMVILSCLSLTACNGGVRSTAPITPHINLNLPSVYHTKFESTNGHTYELTGESNIVISTTFTSQNINFILTDLTKEITPTNGVNQELTFRIEPINNSVVLPKFTVWSSATCQFLDYDNNVASCDRTILTNNTPAGSSYNIVPYTSTGESLLPLTITYL